VYNWTVRSSGLAFGRARSMHRQVHRGAPVERADLRDLRPLLRHTQPLTLPVVARAPLLHPLKLRRRIIASRLRLRHVRERPRLPMRTWPHFQRRLRGLTVIPDTARCRHRWAIAINKKINYQIDCQLFLNWVIGIINWSNWVKKAKFQILITNYNFVRFWCFKHPDLVNK